MLFYIFDVRRIISRIEISCSKEIDQKATNVILSYTNALFYRMRIFRWQRQAFLENKGVEVLISAIDQSNAALELSIITLQIFILLLKSEDKKEDVSQKLDTQSNVLEDIYLIHNGNESMSFYRRSIEKLQYNIKYKYSVSRLKDFEKALDFGLSLQCYRELRDHPVRESYGIPNVLEDMIRFCDEQKLQSLGFDVVLKYLDDLEHKSNASISNLLKPELLQIIFNTSRSQSLQVKASFSMMLYRLSRYVSFCEFVACKEEVATLILSVVVDAVSGTRVEEGQLLFFAISNIYSKAKDVKKLEMEGLKKFLFSLQNVPNTIIIPMYLKVLFTEDELYKSIIKESEIKVDMNDTESNRIASTANISVMKATKPKFGRSNDGWNEGESGLV